MRYGASFVLGLLVASVAASGMAGRGIGGSGRAIGALVIELSTDGDAEAGAGATCLDGVLVTEPLVVDAGDALAGTRLGGVGLPDTLTGSGRAGGADETDVVDGCVGVGASGFAGSTRAAGAVGGAELATGAGLAGAVMPRLIDALIASLRFIGAGVGGGIGGADARTGTATIGRAGTAAGGAAAAAGGGTESLALGAMTAGCGLTAGVLIAGVVVRVGSGGADVAGVVETVEAGVGAGIDAGEVITDADGVDFVNSDVAEVDSLRAAIGAALDDVATTGAEATVATGRVAESAADAVAAGFVVTDDAAIA